MTHSARPSSDRASGDLTGIRLDAGSLRVLAHPLRSRLLSRAAHRRSRHRHRPRDGAGHQLRARRPTTCASSRRSAWSRDTGEGEGKRRLWRAATDFHSYYPSDFVGDEDSETALNWLARDYVRHFSEQAERWVDASPGWPTAWQDACGSSDDMVLLTAEQLSAMRDEIGDVVARYRRVGQGNPDAKRIAVYLFAYALDLENVPAR